MCRDSSIGGGTPEPQDDGSFADGHRARKATGTVMGVRLPLFSIHPADIVAQGKLLLIVHRSPCKMEA